MANTGNSKEQQQSETPTQVQSGDLRPEHMPTWTDTDTIVYLLSNRRRRVIMHQLMTNSRDTISIETIIDTVCTVEHDMGNADSRRQIRDDLYNCQLPRIESSGLIEYDWDDGQCRYLGDPLIESMLESIVAHEFWS